MACVCGRDWSGTPVKLRQIFLLWGGGDSPRTHYKNTPKQTGV